ncbi:hypothetical protein ACQ4PT_002486 [Festuca glaucescens]
MACKVCGCTSSSAIGTGGKSRCRHNPPPDIAVRWYWTPNGNDHSPAAPSRAPPFPELDAARVWPPPPRHLATPQPPLHPARDAALRGPFSASLAAAQSTGHVDGLGATKLFDRLLPTMPWNTLIDTVMGELHAQGKTLHDVAEVLRAAPIDPHVVAVIKAAYGLG